MPPACVLRGLGSGGADVVATLAIARTDDVLAAGGTTQAALTDGFERGSVITMLLSLAAALLAGLYLRRAERSATVRPEPSDPEEAWPRRRHPGQSVVQ